MRKILFAVNITIDGYADHTAGIADDELHDFFADLLDQTDLAVLGRNTYELMVPFWPDAVNNPNITKSELAFAVKYNAVPKIIFSKSLNKVEWNNTKLIKDDAVATLKKMKEESGDYNIFIGGLSIASSLMKENLIDEFWFLVHPVILGKGRHLFDGFLFQKKLNLIESKTFASGVTALHYQKQN